MAAVDTFNSPGVVDTPGVAAPIYTDAFAITTSDTLDLAFVTRAIWVGGAGNIAVVTAGGETVTLNSAAAGALIPLRVSRVKATGTTATNLVGLY